MSRYTSSSASSRRTHNEKNQQILKALLKEPGNKFCADCKTASHPRWASWNLGIFICIRCSGIHRSMGTHISRVKSVDLDSWTDEQVKSMVQWGNDKANLWWEAKLPSSHVPDDSKIENFIRTKYDLKKWAQGPTAPDPATLGHTQPTVSAPAQPVQQVAAEQQIKQSQPQPQQAVNLLDLDFGEPVATPPAATPIAPQQTSSSAASSFLDTPVDNKNSRPDLKKAILSLYSTPTASQSSFSAPQTNYTTATGWPQQAPQQQQQQQQWGASQPKTNPLDDELFKNVWK